MNTGIVLQANQRLLGTTGEAFQICPAASACGAPIISNSHTKGFAPVVTLSDNNEVSGLSSKTLWDTTVIANGPVNLSTGVGGIPITNAKITQNSIYPSLGGAGNRRWE